MSGVTLKVVGLTEFRAGLRGMDRALPKTLRGTLNGVASFFIDKVRPQIPRVTGAAAASLRPQSSQTEARIAVGGSRAPYYPWLDFGGVAGRGAGAKRTFYRAGRYIFPTLARERAEIERVMLDALTELASSNGIEVS